MKAGAHAHHAFVGRALSATRASSRTRSSGVSVFDEILNGAWLLRVFHTARR